MLLDSRIQRQRYGKIFLESLPSYKITDDIREVEAFFEKAEPDSTTGSEPASAL